MIEFSSDLYAARTQMDEEIKRLHAETIKPPLNVRREIVQDVIDRYRESTGRRPEPYHLHRLADYVLVDILTDQHKHRRKDAYPFHTKQQTLRRERLLTTLNDE